MGCDIHVVVEYSDGERYGKREDLDWYDFGPVWFRRDYDLFAAMADVRNWPGSGIECVAQPRGLPDDASYEAKEMNEKYGCDGHSHSWLSLPEFKEAVARASVRYRCHASVYATLAAMSALEEEGMQARIVFFFDN